LLAWSLKLTDHDYQMAEDLVQDTFVQFLLSRPDLAAIDNLDAYLYIMLRYTRLSQARRASQKLANHLSLVQYYSLELGLRAVDLRADPRVQDELRA